MLTRSRSTPARIALFVLMLVVLVWMSLSGLFFQRWLENTLWLDDKWLHFIGFAMTTLVGLGSGNSNAKVVSFLLLFAGAVEGLQLIVPGRVGSLTDFVASAIGIATAWLVFMALRRAFK